MKKLLLISTVILLTSCAPPPTKDDAHSGHEAMTMDDMVNMLEGKTGEEFDKAFIEGMIPHHQGAIDMANKTLQNAEHEELKQMARDIITSQQREIDMMKQWQKDWGYTD